MTQSEKLQSLLQKAVDNGWDEFGHKGVYKIAHYYPTIYGTIYVCTPYTDKHTYKEFRTQSSSQIIFNHDFAKALFGEDWKIHIQKAVISEVPIDYLYKAVFPSN